MAQSYVVDIGGRRFDVRVSADGPTWRVDVDGKGYAVDRLAGTADGPAHLLLNGRGREVVLRRIGSRTYDLLSDALIRKAEVHEAWIRRLARSRIAETAAREQTIEAPIPGSIVRVLIEVGQSVEAGQPLVILEAMKMQNEILSPFGGTIGAVHVAEGQTVMSGERMIVITSR